MFTNVLETDLCVYSFDLKCAIVSFKQWFVNVMYFLGIAHCLHMDFGPLSEKERKDGYSSPFSSPSLHTGGSQTSCPSPLSSTPTPVPTRRLAKSFSVTPSTVTKGRLLLRGCLYFLLLMPSA